MKKRTVAICLCIILALGGIAATLAYFTDSEKAVNTFTVGHVDISLDETDVDLMGNKDGDTRVTSNQYKLIPGNTYTKDPTIHVLDGSEPCWVFVTVEISQEFSDVETLEYDKTIAGQMANLGWKKITDPEAGINVYAYEAEPVEAGEDKAVFNSITVGGPEATKATLQDIDQETMIKITGYAIQAAGFDTAKKAWDAAYTQF